MLKNEIYNPIPKNLNVGNLKKRPHHLTKEIKKMDNEKWVCLTHNDLDAAGCVLILNKTIKPIKYFYTNYYDMHCIFDDLINYIKETKITNVIICDVALSQFRESLINLQRELYNLSHNYKLQIFDHHLYPDNFFVGVTAETDIDGSRCGSKIVYDYYAKRYNLYQLKDIIDTINAYDIWLTDNPNFNRGLALNEFFFLYKNGNNNRIYNFANELELNEFSATKLMGSYPSELKKDFEILKEELKQNKKYIRSQSGVKTTLILTWDYFSLFTYHEMQAKQEVVIGIKYGIFRIRVAPNVFTDAQLAEIRQELCGDSNFGHKLAFTYRAKETKKPSDIINELIKITNILNRYN